jgi:PAS domain S-box-containing protein
VLQTASILPQSLAARYSVAVVAVAVAFVTTSGADGVLSGLPLFAYIPAVLITAAISGFGPATLAILFSTLAINQSFHLPSVLQAERIVLFDGYSLLLAWFLATYRAEMLRVRGEQVQNLELIVNAAPVMAWILDRSGGCIYVNQRWLAFTGRRLEEERGDGWMDSIFAEDREAALAAYREALARRDPFRIEYRQRRHDGTNRWIYSYGVPHFTAAHEFNGYIGSAVDIDEVKTLEESLRFLGLVSDVLAGSLDLNTTLRTAASLAVPLLGDLCMIDLVEGDTIRRVAAHHADPQKQALAERLASFPPDPHATHGAAEAIRSMKPQYGDSIPRELLDSLGLTAEHRELALAIGVEAYMIVPMEARGRAVGAIHLSSPRTAHYREHDRGLAGLFARRVAMALDNAQLYHGAVEASRAKDQFLATVSHELRTPMTATLGWVRMLGMGHTDDETRTLALEAIERSTRAQARLIDDILDVSGIVTGKFRLETGPVDLPAVIENAIATLRPAAEAKQIAIGVDSAGWSGVLQGDANRLQQVIWNLFSNAVKFGRRGGRIDVRLRRADQLARLTVTDDGTGIEAAFLPHVFERFRQADASLTRAHGGLGLGLAIVRHLVELHGGTVHAESEGSERGATFTVELPLTAYGPAGNAIPAVIPLPRLDMKRVLVVDDEDDARSMVSAILRRCGAAVTTASSADEALTAMAEPHDLVITDLAMPGQDGFALVEKLRIRGDQTKAIALTAIADVSGHPEFLRILRKPIDPMDLARAVAKELSSS